MATKFDEVFLGYEPCQVSVWNQCFEDYFGHRCQGSDDHNASDGLRRLHCIMLFCLVVS